MAAAPPDYTMQKDASKMGTFFLPDLPPKRIRGDDNTYRLWTHRLLPKNS